MTSWKTYRLGELVKVKGGKRLPKGISLQIAPNTHPYIRIRDMGKSRVLELDATYEYVDDVTQKSIARYVVDEGDILLSIVGTIGLVGIVGKSLHQANQTENCVKLVSLNGIDPLFLYYFLLSPKGQEEIKRGTVGAVQAKLPIKNIENIEISFPPLAEQRRIAGILGAIDDKIENNRRINANLELQAQALYKQWFVDFEFPNEEGKPYKSSGGKMVDSELGPIPEGWRVGDIYKYIKVIFGAPYKSSLFNEKKEGNPLIRIRDLKTFAPQYYTKEILPNTEFVNAGDVVAGMDAEFEPCLWLGERGVLNQRCCKFVGTIDTINNYYVMYLLKPELEFVQSYKTGTTVSHLGKADIDRFKVIEPPLFIIEKFSQVAKSLLDNKVKLAKENINLATLRDTLLPKLMNGEIKL